MTKMEFPARDPDAQRLSTTGDAIDLPVQASLAAGVTASVNLAEAHSEQATEAQTWLNEGGAVGAPATCNPLRILLVEDDVMIAPLIAETLTEMGHEVCGIANCEEAAVTMAARDHPDLLIVDAHLDVGSGLEAVRRILLNGPLPHIFISGDVISPEHLGPGALALQKPFQDVDLERAIQQALAPAPSG